MPERNGMLKCGIYFLIGLNICFAIVGITFTALGITGVVGSVKVDLLVKRSTVAMHAIHIVIGLLLIIMAYFGCYAVNFENRCMILTYSGVMTIIVVLRLVTIVTALGDISKFDAEKATLKQNFNDSMNKYDSNEKIKDAWDFFQKHLQCCGVDNYTDWGGNIPNSCCQEELEEGEKCPIKKRFKEGCWKKMFEGEDATRTGITIGLILALLLEISGVVSSCLMARAFKGEQIPPGQ